MKHVELPELPYELNALEPVISKQIMELHWGKHHRAYVNNFNIAVDQLSDAEKTGDVEKMISLQSALKFNGGGHINHSIFWNNLAPKNSGGGEPPAGELAEAIKQQFGSLEKLIEEMSAKTAAIQGSGWGWLGLHPTKKTLQIATCTNQDPLITQGLFPLLGIDVWEHAYYLQYLNARPDYLKAIWSIINWTNVQERYEMALVGKVALTK